MLISDTRWFYAAIVAKDAYDGDTWYLNIDMGFNVWANNKIVRLYGIDTPELRGTDRLEGLRVRDYVRQIYPIGTEIMIKTHKDKSGKYGRYLVDIITDFTSTDDYQTFNQKLVDMKLAKPLLYNEV